MEVTSPSDFTYALVSGLSISHFCQSTSLIVTVDAQVALFVAAETTDLTGPSLSQSETYSFALV
jgi:hypothetical protein